MQSKSNMTCLCTLVVNVRAQAQTVVYIYLYDYSLTEMDVFNEIENVCMLKYRYFALYYLELKHIPCKYVNENASSYASTISYVGVPTYVFVKHLKLYLWSCAVFHLKFEIKGIWLSMATLVDVTQLRGQKRSAFVYNEGSILSILQLSEDILDNPAWAEPLPLTTWGHVPLWTAMQFQKSFICPLLLLPWPVMCFIGCFSNWTCRKWTENNGLISLFFV